MANKKEKTHSPKTKLSPSKKNVSSQTTTKANFTSPFRDEENLFSGYQLDLTCIKRESFAPLAIKNPYQILLEQNQNEEEEEEDDDDDEDFDDDEDEDEDEDDEEFDDEELDDDEDDDEEEEEV